MNIAIDLGNTKVLVDVRVYEKAGNVIATARIDTTKGPIVIVSRVSRKTLKEIVALFGARVGDDNIGGFWDRLKKLAKSKAVQSIIKTLSGIGKNPQALAALSAIPYAGPVLAGGATAAAALEPAASLYERVQKGDPKALANVRMLARNAPFNPVAQKALQAIAKAKDLGEPFSPLNAALVGARYDELKRILQPMLRR